MASTTINHQFTAATIDPGDVSQYRITIANSSLVPLTAAAVTEVLPPQITIASPTGITNTCGFTVSAAAPGTSTVFLTAGTIPAGTGAVDGQCFFQINVTATAPGNWVATIPANTTPNGTTSGYTAKEAGVDIWNTTPASATLSVNTLLVPTVGKVFAPSPAIAGDPTTLTITLTNPNAASTIPLTTFTDTLPAGMVVANPATASTSCAGVGAVNGVVTATLGATTISLAGGTIGKGSTCTIAAKVVVAAIVGTTQTFTNSLGVGAIGNTRGLTSLAFNRNLVVNTPITVTKTFGTPNIPAGQPSLTTIVIGNASTVNVLNITSFADNLTGTTLKILNTASLPLAAPANPAVVCSGVGFAPGVLSAPADLLDQTITLTGAKAGPGGNCTITAYLTSNVDGAHVNSIPANAVVNPNSYASPGPVTATLTANAQLTVAKTVSVANVAPGQWTEFTVAINNFSGGPVTSVTFKDVLPKNGANQMTLFDAGSGFFTDPGPGCSGGVFTGTDATGASTGLAPTAADAGLLWTGGTIIAGVGVNPGVCTINIWAKLPASAATGLTFTNTIPVGGITGTGPAGGIGNINAGSVNVVSIASGAVTKGFNLAAIAQGQTSTLTITLFNRTVVPLTGVVLTDNLPAGVTLAASPAPTNTCGGSLQAFPNDVVVKLTGGTVAARPIAAQDSNCVITVKVTGTALGVKTNTINPADFTSNEGVSIPVAVTANLTINTGITAAKTFTPASTASGGVSRVKITVTDASNGGLTNVSVDDNTFTGGLTVANPANAATNCAGSPTMVVNPGIARAQLLGATLVAGGACDFSFDVVTSGVGPWTNTVPIGKITSAEGASNTAVVTANLTVTAAQININKSFNPVLVTGGQPSILQIDVINPSVTAMTGVGFTDTFPVGIEIYSVPSAGTTCAGGIVTAIPGDGKVRLTGASLAASATCNVTVTTTSTRFLNLTNTIPAGAVVSNQGYTNPLGTSATLSTLQGLNVLKAFSPAYVIPGQVSTLRMSLVSSFDPNAPTPLTLHGVTYTDTLPNNVFIAATPNAATDCAGTGPGGLAVVSPSNVVLNGLVTVTQGTIAPGTSCSITVDTVSNVLGAYNNTIPASSITTDEGIPNQAAANATLFVVSRPTVSKTFAATPRNPGQTTTMTVTITNGATVPITGVSLVDTLPAGLAIASVPGTGGTCTAAGGVVSATGGGGTLSVAGATLAAGANCTFFATVVSNTPGVYINSINPGSIVTNEGLTNPGPLPATATLTVNAPPTVSKAFNPVSIAAGATSTLTLTFGNTNASAITLSALFTDALPGNVFVAAVPNVSKTCAGAVAAAAGTNFITYANGAAIQALIGCTISVDVTSAIPGTYTNLIAAGQLSTSALVNEQPASASLGVGPAALVPPTMAKSFSPSTIFVGDTSALTISLGNPNGSPLTLAADLTDNLPVGVTVAAVPNSRGTCTGAVTAAAGQVKYSSGSTIPAGGCTIIVDVTSAAAGSYSNTIPTSALVTDGGSPTLPAVGSLVVKALTPPTVLKSFSPGTINPGGTSTLTISIGNSNASALTLSSAFTDNLPGSVSVAASPNASTTCTGGSVSTAASSVTLTGGSIQPGGCIVVVDVTSSTPGGPYTNTIAANALQTSGGNNGAAATDRLFVNPFQPPSVAKTFSPAVIGSGGISRFTLTISNGNLTAATLTADLVDTFPGPGLVIATPSNLLLGSGCTAADVVANAGATTVTYKTGGALPANGGCSIQVDVTSSTVRSYANSVASGAVQTTVGNNAVSASAILQVLALPTVTKTFVPASIPLGANSSLTLTLGNTNAVALTLASDFVDLLPTNLVLGTPATLTGTCTAAGVVAAAGGSSITYKSGASIPAGGCTITVPVTPALAGGYDNVIGANTLVTSIGSNASGTTAHLDVLQADLAITKTDGVTTIVPGTATTYTIAVSNAGPSAVTNAPVADPLPASIASWTWTCAASAGSSCGAASGSGSINTTVSLLSGGTATYTVTANVAPAAVGSLVNTATVAVPAGVSDPNPANNSATDTDTLTPSADLAVTKVGPATLVPGQNATYTISATNGGPSTATSVSLADTLPPGTTFFSLASPGGWSCTTPVVGAAGAVTCTLPVFAAGAPAAVFTLVVRVDPSVVTGTLISNTATVSSATPDPTPGNNTSTATGTASASADLSIAKTGPATAVPGGSNVVFTTVVTNNGPSDAQGVSVADPTPAGLVFVSNANACTTAFPCDLGSVPAGATRTITSTYQIPSGYPAPSPIVNVVTVSSTTSDPTPGNNSSTATVPVPTGVADIAVTKTVDNVAPSVGSNVTFTLTTSNLGPSDASGVAVTDVLPSGLTFASATPSQGTYSSATGVWSIGAVVVGASPTLQIVATVTQAGTIVNVATKTAGNEIDPNPSNNSGSAVVNGPAAVADVQVQKTVDVPAPSVGANVTFTIAVLNAGPSTATNVAVTDLLPPGLTFVSATPATGTYTSATGVWAIGTLANGASTTLTVTANVTAAGTYVNTATKTAETELDPNTSNDSAVAGVVAGGSGTPRADLGIQKTDSPDPVRAGQNVTYSLVVTNRGPNDATGVTVTDPLPAGVTLLSTSASQGTCSGTTTVTCLLGSLPAGNSATVSILVSVSASAVPSITNTAVVSATEIDPNPADNSSTATTTVIAPDLTITKGHAPSSFVRGSPAAYTLTVSSLTGATAAPTSGTITVTDTLPAGLTPTLAGGVPDWTCGIAAQTVTCTTSNVLAPGASYAAISVDVAVLESAPAPVSNTATVSGGGDVTPGNDSATDVAPVISSGDLSITKTDGVAAVIPGATTTYTITVSNAGPSTVLNAPVADALPASIASATWTCAASVGSSCGSASGSGSIATTVSLLSGGTATYTVVANVAPAALGSLVNTATVSVPAGVTDPNPANNASTDTDTLTPQADLSVVKTGPATLVPGQNATYTISATNGGLSTATSVSLTDTLPAGTTFFSLASPGGWTCATPAVGAGGTITCTLPVLAAGAPAAVFTLVVHVDPSVLTGTVISNTATVSSATPDPTPGNNSSTATGTASPSAELSIAKTGPATAVPGGPNVVFTTVVTNNGPSDAQAVSVADPTPANLTFVSNAGACTTAFPCGLGTIPAGAARTITSTYQVPSGYPAPAPIVNVATVSSTTSDPDPANNSSTATVLVPTGVADIAVAKTVDNAAPSVGANVTFTITASDLGPSDASGVAITDVLPSGLTFASATPSQGTYSAATGVWSVGGIAVGALPTLQIVATVTQAGTIVNTATKTAGDQTDPNPSNNSGSAVVNGPASVADIQVQKTVDVPAPAVSANVTFTVRVLNAGPSGATGVAVTDLLPPGLTFVSATPAAGTSYAPGTGVWTIGSMPNGGSVTLALVANVPAAGTFVNTATKTAENELDPNTSNDSAVAGVVAGGGGTPQADLGIQKTDSPDPVHAGQNLTYTLVVTNRGPNDATGVTVTDPLPAGVALVTASASQGGCSGTTTVTCLLGALPAGNSATVSIVVSVSATAVPSISNTAAVAATETDPNPADNSSTATTTVTPVADIAIAKTVSNPAPLVTQGFTFTVTATNNGPSTANGVVVTDVLPANLGFVSATPSQGGYVSATGVWTVGTLANGASATLTLAVTAVSPGAFTNTATKTGETEVDPDPTNDAGAAGGGVGVLADLTIVKSHAPATFLRGSSSAFSLTVSNVGTGPTAGLVTVSDTLPAGLTPTAAAGSGWVCTVTAPSISCTRSDALGVGFSWPVISVTASVAQAAPANVSNTATVSGGGDITPGNDSSTDVVPVSSEADLAITKTGPANAIPGNNIVYTLVVTNNGPSDAAAVSVTDPTPTNLTFVSNAGACVTAFPCNLGTIAAGASATITATFFVPAGYTAPSPIVNAASVSSTTADPNPANNGSSASTSMAADLSVMKTIGSSPVLKGQPFTYSIVVTNHGPSTATGVTLTDPLPSAVRFVSFTTTQGSCSGSSTVTCALGTLLNGASATVRITVAPVTSSSSVTNTATVSANEFDPDGSNNTSTADLSFLDSIPTLSEWALLALTLALALAGMRALRRGV